MLNVVDYLFVGYKMKSEVWAEAEREAVRRGLLEKGGYMTIREEIAAHRQEGRQARDREVILNMLQEKLDASLIAKVTGLPEAEIIIKEVINIPLLSHYSSKKDLLWLFKSFSRNIYGLLYKYKNGELKNGKAE